MVVEIDGAAQQLAPGARIRDASNRIIPPTAIPPATLVKVRARRRGQKCGRYGFLTPEEAQR